MTNICLRTTLVKTQLTLAINIRQGKWTTPRLGQMNSNITLNTNKTQSKVCPG